MQPDFEIKHHPVDLSNHGLNPYGQALYRVVWADSRLTRAFCNGKMHTLKRYTHEPDLLGHWIIEKWKSPEELLGMSREQWDAFLLTFPNAAVEEYPERGDYDFERCFNEDSGPFARNIDEVALHKQLAVHEFRLRNTSVAERMQESVQQEEKQAAVAEQKFDALFEEAREESECLQK